MPSTTWQIFLENFFTLYLGHSWCPKSSRNKECPPRLLGRRFGYLCYLDIFQRRKNRRNTYGIAEPYLSWRRLLTPQSWTCISSSSLHIFESNLCPENCSELFDIKGADQVMRTCPSTPPVRQALALANLPTQSHCPPPTTPCIRDKNESMIEHWNLASKY